MSGKQGECRGFVRYQENVISSEFTDKEVVLNEERSG